MKRIIIKVDEQELMKDFIKVFMRHGYMLNTTDANNLVKIVLNLLEEKNETTK